MKYVLILLSLSYNVFANGWNSLWKTHDQQAQVLMRNGQFAAAEASFDNLYWKGVAAYRAQHYQQAAHWFSLIKTQDAYYNLGNALAQAKQYAAAIQAYNAVLNLNSQHQDAKYNKHIVADLLKQQQSPKPQMNSNKTQNSQKNQKNKKKRQQITQQSRQQRTQENEQQHEQQQWLHILPDDPGGLLREKLLRDHLRRQSRLY